VTWDKANHGAKQQHPKGCRTLIDPDSSLFIVLFGLSISRTAIISDKFL